MNFINNNPYRILGLPITANEREITKQINILATYAEMGKTKTLDTDFSFLPQVSRTAYAIEEAKKQIEQSEGKLLYSLFWFWKNNSVDELALEVLKEGNIEKAIGIWEKSVLVNKNKVFKTALLIKNLINYSKNWIEEDNENHVLKKNEDQYIIERKKETSYSIPTIFAEFNYEDNWMIDCDTTWLSGIDNNGYGIVFGREKGSFFSFEITANGYFRFDKYIDWSFTKIIPWQTSPYVEQWSSNNLRIKKTLNQLNFYINENLVGTHESEPFFGKYFGFKLTSNQKVSFRNFKFCKLEEDVTYGEGINVTAKNFSNIKNLSTLYLSLTTNNGAFLLENFKKGVALAKAFFLSVNMEEYSKLITGEKKYVYNAERALNFYITGLIDSVKDYLEKPSGISTGQLLTFFSNFPVEAKQYLNNRFVAKQIQNIEKEIENTQTERKKNPLTASSIGKQLVNKTIADIKFLKNSLGDVDFQYQLIADKLSLTIMQCGIDAFNANKNNLGEIDFAKAIKAEEVYLKEYEYAFDIAATERTKEKLQENLKTCKDWISNKHLYNCWFCENKSPEKASKFEITIYKETYRVYRRVQFSYVPVTIPRCNDCQKKHRQGSVRFTLALIGCIITGVIIGAFADGYWLVGLIIGLIIGWILGESLKRQHFSKSGIKDTRQSTIKNYPTLNKMLKEGWQFSKPSA